MGHHEQSLVTTLQIALEPDYHVEVQMVGRLVEHQKVRFGDEDISQSHTLLLASAELAHRLRKVSNLQLGENLLRLENALLVAMMIEASIEHTLLGIKCWRLGEKSHAYVAAIDDAAIVIALLVHEDFHECRLSRTVLCYQSDTLSLAYAEVDVTKQHLGAE